MKRVKVEEVKEGWVRFMSDGWKMHFVDVRLLSGLMEDSASRNHASPFYEPVTKAWIDLPGMILQDRSIEEFSFDGITLEMPSEDFEHFRESLRDKKVREFSDGRKYFKIHGWLHCVVFTPEQRDACLALMDARAEEARARGEADKKRFREGIAAINKDGVKVMSVKAPDSIPKVPLAGKPNNEKN
jgi:hypothetical protein